LTEIKAVIFDLDGTLADSKETIVELFQRLFTEFGFPTPTPARILEIEQFGRRRIIELILPEEKRGDGELRARMFERCGVLAREVLVKIKPAKGAGETLAWLKKRGVKVALATNRGSTTEDLLRLLGLRGYFDAVVTSEHVRDPKPHPESLLLALERLGAKPGEALFVGDSGVDLEAGRAAGIKTVLLDKELNELSELKRWFDGRKESSEKSGGKGKGSGARAGKAR